MMNHLTGFLNKCVQAFRRDSDLETASSLKQSLPQMTSFSVIMYGIMTEELVIHEIRIDEAAGSRRFRLTEVIMPLKAQSTKILIYSI